MIYICIDLKSFYASVECVDRGMDPLSTNLVVADESRTEKTICLAVTPALKAYGISGRARLYEVIQRVQEINAERLKNAPYHEFSSSSWFERNIKASRSTQVDFITAPPRMSRYIDVSTKIYSIYLRFIAPEDIHVYSIDEVFIDVTNYLDTYRCTAYELVRKMIREVLNETGITATAGIGTNLYLAKIAMDIVAKKMQPDKDGVRIAELDEMSYRKKLWSHKPLTDFWRYGNGISRRLEKYGVYTMGELAALSERNDELLYREFGVNAELIIDHAWGWESCTIADIKAYTPENRSISQGQVLAHPYSYEKAGLILKEMADNLSLDLTGKCAVTNRIVVTVCYDHSCIPEDYEGRYEVNYYGKTVPAHAHGTENLSRYTSLSSVIVSEAMKLYRRIADSRLLVRRLNITACDIIAETMIPEEPLTQYSLFDDIEKLEMERKEAEIKLEREKNIQKALVKIKEKYGKNAVLKGMNYLDGATAKERNVQIGGHKS